MAGRHTYVVLKKYMVSVKSLAVFVPSRHQWISNTTGLATVSHSHEPEEVLHVVVFLERFYLLERYFCVL